MSRWPDSLRRTSPLEFISTHPRLVITFCSSGSAASIVILTAKARADCLAVMTRRPEGYSSARALAVIVLGLATAVH